MIRLFDLHPRTGNLALWRLHPDGRYQLTLRSLSGQPLGEIPARYLPLMPHWSPDGAALAFGSNDGILYTSHPGDGAPQVVFSHPNLQAGFCEWTAGGRQLVFSASGKEPHTSPSIYRLALDGGQTQQLTDDPNAVDRFPHVSPSGRWVAFQRQFLDEPGLPRHVYICDAQTGDCFPLLDGFAAEVDTARFAWSRDSSALLVRLTQQGRSRLAVIRIADQAILWRYEAEAIQGGAFSPQGDRILCICTDELLWFAYPQGTLLQRISLESAAPVHFYLTGAQIGFDPGAETLYFLGENSCLYRWQIGASCECILEDRPLDRPDVPREEYTVPARDGRLIPVQRFLPPNPRRPAVLYVHGGPGEAIDPHDPLMLGLLDEGIEVICAAYRGSSGYGVEHAEANRGEYGRADVWDLLAVGSDWKTRAGSDRPLFIAGYSYGGFLTLLALAQDSNPWAGGITLWAVSDLSHMGLHHPRAYPAALEQQARAHVERSPLQQAGRIHVPLLIFHGAQDTAATTAEMQAIQQHVLDEGGQCELIIFDDDTHGLMRHRDEIHTRMMAFLRRLEQ